MKKKFTCLILIICLMFSFSSCTYERKQADAEKIAREEFGVEEILAVAYCSSNCLFLRQEESGFARYAYCVVGEKNGEELFVVVPALENDLPFLAEWVFDYTYTDTISFFEENVGYNVSSSTSFRLVDLSEGTYYFTAYDLRSIELDVVGGLMIGESLIVQSNGELLIFGEGMGVWAVESLVKENFGVEEISWISKGIDESVQSAVQSDKEFYYVLGIKDGEEIFLKVPSNPNKEVAVIEWVFSYSFEEMITALNDYVGRKVYIRENENEIRVLKSESQIVDNGIMLSVNGQYLIAQSNGELVFFTV